MYHSHRTEEGKAGLPSSFIHTLYTHIRYIYMIDKHIDIHRRRDPGSSSLTFSRQEVSQVLQGRGGVGVGGKGGFLAQAAVLSCFLVFWGGGGW